MPKMRGVVIDAFCPSTSLTQKQLYNLVLIIGKLTRCIDYCMENRIMMLIKYYSKPKYRFGAA